MPGKFLQELREADDGDAPAACPEAPEEISPSGWVEEATEFGSTEAGALVDHGLSW